MDELFLLVILTFAAAAGLIHRLRSPARKIGIVDTPGGRKQHEDLTPLVGGIGIFVAFTLGVMFLDSGLSSYRALFAVMGLLLIVGLLDDLHDLEALEKFALHIAAALALVLWGGLVVDHLGVLPGLGHLALGWFAIPFTVICVVGLINAVNMLDGIDGLAGAIVLSMLFWLAVAGVGSADPVAVALPILLAAAIVGFLVFNFPVPWRARASVFMGDSGSTMLGFALGWFAIDLVYEQGLGVPPVTVAWIMALPVFDTILLMLRRIGKGRNPMIGDREHLHHIFIRAGFSARDTVYLAMLASLVVGGIGVLGWKLGASEPLLWLLLVGVFVLHGAVLRHAWRVMRLLHRLRRFGARRART